jgi:2,3-bisphosphoglycerate-dependent phosphoglycerate mutase
MRLYFIRHGQSANNALWDETGSSTGRSDDPILTPTGHEQARLLGQFLLERDLEARADGTMGNWGRDSFLFTHLYTSLMVRAVDTAMHIGQALGLAVTAWPDIHECGGIYEEGEDDEEHSGRPGKPRSYFAATYPGLALPESITEAGWWNRPYERRDERPMRARQVLGTLLAKHGGTEDHVAIVSHGAFYQELLRVIFQCRPVNFWFLMNNTGVTRFDFRENGETLMVYHNRTDHLPARLVT